jgi:putative ABC transport system ATP-binding protein
MQWVFDSDSPFASEWMGPAQDDLGVRMTYVSAVTNPIVLRAEHLGRTVRDKILVEDVNFELQKGGVLAITGSSGSGKTSLLRLLNRLDEPTSGTVLVEGADYHNIEARELRRKLGMVTQRPYLFPGSVADNLRFGPAQRGETLPLETIEELLNQVGLKDYSGRDVANLSGGEAQRVSVARALANSPLALLLDEPTAALDEAAKLEVESAIQKVMRDQGLTCVVVTHDIAQAARLAERALVVEHGRIARAGPVGEVLRA